MIADDEIHVWLARTDVPAPALERKSEVLDDVERARAASFHFDADRARSIIARSTLRQLLGRYLDRDPREFRFVFGEHGKPALAGGELEFNVSHSGERVAIAFTRREAVGIDIERDHERHRTIAIARRFFAPAEAAEVERDGARFYPIWTAKEAVIKALGTGLAMDLRSFEAFAMEGWFVRALSLEAGYYGAVAVRGDGWKVSVREFG
jgi:4'-phosphopantetheinyl transferase